MKEEVEIMLRHHPYEGRALEIQGEKRMTHPAGRDTNKDIR